MNGKVLKIVSAVAVVAGLALNVLNSIVTDATMDEKIDKKLKEALNQEEES